LHKKKIRKITGRKNVARKRVPRTSRGSFWREVEKSLGIKRIKKRRRQ